MKLILGQKKNGTLPPHMGRDHVIVLVVLNSW